jgi:hypothetical protein
VNSINKASRCHEERKAEEEDNRILGCPELLGIKVVEAEEPEEPVPLLPVLLLQIRTIRKRRSEVPRLELLLHRLPEIRPEVLCKLEELTQEEILFHLLHLQQWSLL